LVRALVNAGVAAAMLLCRPAGAGEAVRILVLGDSLTAGYGLARGAAFPARLEEALRAAGVDARVINAGVSGDTTSAGRARLDWALAGDPDAVIVELGANDGLRGLDPDITFANLDAILTRLGTKGLPVLLVGMRALPNLGREYGSAFAAVYSRLAQKHKVPLYPFFLEGVAAKPELNLDDHLHPNARGVDVIVEKILPEVKRLVDGIR
jgi:acyl-CoA thioesterase-1